MRKIKVLHLQVLPLLSGVQNMMISLLSGLDPDKYDIYVVSKGGGVLVDKVREHGWTHIAVDSLCREFSLKDFVSAVKICKIIRKIKPDIVHTHSAKTGFLGRIIARLLRVPLVIHTIHGFPFHPYQNKIVRGVYIILETFAAFFAHYNVCVQQYERDYAIHRYGFNKKKTVTIYNGILPYHNQKKDFSTGDALKIVSVLRFWKQKNVVFTIQQAVSIVQKFPNISFTFYGDGELFDACQKIVANNNVADKIILNGWSTNVLDELLKYDVFLLNSLWEGLPISILEAMSVGLPIICSNIKGNNELVNNSNGWLVDPTANDAIYTVLKEILADKTILQKKGVESMNIVTNRFHYELFIKGYVDLYERVKVYE